jgi:hypothetical protein
LIALAQKSNVKDMGAVKPAKKDMIKKAPYRFVNVNLRNKH